MLPFVPAVADGDTEVERLIKELGSDEFDERETATKRLQEIGDPALGALYKAATSADAEVRLRAEYILDKLYPELRLTGHTGAVWSVCVSADGKRVMTSVLSADRALVAWPRSIARPGAYNRAAGLPRSPMPRAESRYLMDAETADALDLIELTFSTARVRVCSARRLSVHFLGSEPSSCSARAGCMKAVTSPS